MSSVEMLHALAAGLCQDARVRLEVGGAEWAWSPTQRVLLVPAHAIADFGVEACAGVVAHEIGHAYLSRYQLFADVRAASPFVRLVMNALEDPRVEGFMQRRYPGSAPWLAASLGAVDPKPPRLPSLQLLARFVVEGGIDVGTPGFAALGAVEGLHPDVVAALAATREARVSYVRDHWPATDFGGAPAGVVGRYALELVPALAEGASPWPPAAAEAWVRLLAFAALRVAWDGIVPAALTVLEADVGRIARLVDVDSGAAAAARAKSAKLKLAKQRQQQKKGKAPPPAPKMKKKVVAAAKPRPKAAPPSKKKAAAATKKQLSSPKKKVAGAAPKRK